MSDIVCSSVTYSVTVDLNVLERHLDPEFVSLLCKQLHVDSLTSAHMHVDYVNDALTFNVLKVPDDA